MRLLLLTLSAGISILATGCTSHTPVPVPIPVAAHPPQEPKNKAGEFLITPYHHLLKEAVCTDTKHFPEATFELQTIAPEAISPGQQLTHTLVYTVCAKDLEQFVSGTLYRKIYRGNQLVHSEPKSLDLKPGRWTLKAFIEVPQQSKTGSYELRTEFIGKGKHPKDRLRLQTNTTFKIVETSD